MNGERIVRVMDPKGQPLACVGTALCTNASGQSDFVKLDGRAKGEFVVSPALLREAAYFIFVPQEPGNWITARANGGANAAIVCEPLGDGAQPNWWHTLLDRHIDNPERGKGIKIGIVDTNYIHHGGLEAVEHITMKGGNRRRLSANTLWDHGEAVCRIIGDRDAPPGCAPIAPGASLYFASASFSDISTRHPSFSMPAAGIKGVLDPALINEALFTLTVEKQVDLINLSLGTFERVDWERGLAAAIDFARSRGVAIVCAAGNEAVREAAFPARLASCIGVGAYGLWGWGPPGSMVEAVGQQATAFGAVQALDIFHSPSSAYGNGIDTIAPGVGIQISRNGRPAFDLTGTSFAAPIATGLLAVALSGDTAYLALPHDETRARYAEQRLRELCRSAGLGADYDDAGAIQL